AQLASATASLATLLPGGGYEFAFATKTYSSLAAGCPVIFAGPGPTRDFLTAASETVPIGYAVAHDASAIAQAMERFATMPLTADDRRRIATWAETHISLRAAARRTVAAIEEAAA